MTIKKMVLGNFKINKTSLQLIFKNPEAEKNWKGIINDLGKKVQDLELLSVVKDQRPCAWQTIRESQLFDYIKKCSNMGLTVYPIKRVGSWSGFIHYTPQPEKGKDNNIYCIISKNPEYANKFRIAHETGDHITQGEMLGFPKCCTEKFTEWWAEGYYDPVYQSYNNSKEAHPLSNPLLRYINIRVGFHIPCSFDCAETIKTGRQRISLMDTQNRKLLLFLLCLDVHWTCLHGIAEIETDLFKIITTTVPTNTRYEINLKGLIKPKEVWDGRPILN